MSVLTDLFPEAYPAPGVPDDAIVIRRGDLPEVQEIGSGYLVADGYTVGHRDGRTEPAWQQVRAHLAGVLYMEARAFEKKAAAVAEAEAHARLTERRDALAQEFWKVHEYSSVSIPGQVVIDKYIALEDKVAA